MEQSPENLVERLRKTWPHSNWKSHRVVVAVSGGADSVALLRLLAGIADPPQNLIAAHFNHGWRGSESDQDERFVQSLAGELGIECHCDRVSQQSASENESSNRGQGAEALARNERYHFLKQVAVENGARYLVTAHNADDQVETVLHRIFRGTGIDGLGGIRPLRYLGDGLSLVRPLLPFTRSEIVDYLEEIGQTFQTDSSNSDPAFTRNEIRNDVLPWLRDRFGNQLDQNIRRLGQHAAASQAVIDSLVDELSSSAVSSSTDQVINIDCRVLEKQPQHIICELLRRVWRDNGWPERDMDTAKWQQLAGLTGEIVASPITLPGNIMASRDGETLSLQK